MRETDKSKTKFLWLLFSAYGLVTLVLTIRHAMWRDELYYFSLGKSSGSFLDLVENASTNPRPLGWTTISWVATKFVSSPDVLKYINWIFALGLGYTVLFRFPIRLLTKTSFMFGFLVLLGYSHIAEDYMLALLLSALLVVAYLERRPQYLVLIFAGLLANTHPLFWGISIGAVFLSLTVRIDLGNSEGFKWGKVRGSLGRLSLYLIALGAGVAPTISSVDAASRIHINLMVGAKRALRSVTLGLFPFITDNGSASPLFYAGTVIGIAIIGWLAFLAYKAGIYTAVGILLMNSVALGIVAFIRGDYWWHYGVVFVSFFLSAVVLINSDRLQMKRRRHVELLLLSVLCCQVVASFIGPRTTLWETQPYSNAKSTANFLRSECADDCTIISNSQVTGVGVSAYLGGRSIYYVDKGAFGTFTIWSSSLLNEANWDQVVSAARKFDNPLIVVSEMGPPPRELVVIESFTGAVWADEDFTVLRFASQS